MMKRLSVLALIVASFNTAHAQEIHSDHYLYGLPNGLNETNDLIFRRAYVLSNNDNTKFADWVAYKLTPHDVWEGPDLHRKWYADPHLEEDETLEPSPDDYTGAHAAHKYERGHLAPLASFKGVFYASEVNYYSNITPQTKALNNGPWKWLEMQVRDYIKKGREVWVQTGPIYKGTAPALPGANEDHKVPTAFWKLIMNEKGNTAAFIMEQNPAGHSSVKGYAVSINEIESQTGLNLNPFKGETGESTKSVNWLFN